MEVDCPFCKDKGMDLIGLKAHFDLGYCDIYNTTMTIEEEREAHKNGTLTKPSTEEK